MVRKTLRRIKNGAKKVAGQIWSATTWIFREVVKFLGWSGQQLNKGFGKLKTAGGKAKAAGIAALAKAKRADERVVGWAEKLGGDRKLKPGFTSSFGKAYWEGIQELFTLKYWIKWFIRVNILVAVMIIFLTLLGAGMSVSLPAISFPANEFFTSSGFVSPIFTPEVRRWTPFLMWWGAKYGVDPNAAATLMQIESCGDPGAVSTAGAQGLFQVMPFHFEEGEIMLNPGTNAKRGLTYFKLRLQASEGDYGTAFATYYGGPGAADLATRSEMATFYSNLASGIYEDARAGKKESETLTTWLESGGYSFCSQAAKFPIKPFLGWTEGIQLIQPNDRGDNKPFEGAEAALAELLDNIQQVAPSLEGNHVPLIPGLFPHMRTETACDDRGLPLDNYISGYTFTYNQATNSGHAGMDVATYVGEPIPTTMSGMVAHAGWNNQGYGNLVIVSNGVTQTYYAHLSEVLVSYGDQVVQGDIIGKGGTTGNSTGPHLHYEVRANWVPINPLSNLAYSLTCAGK